MLAGYDHFVALARSLQWQQGDVDLSADAEAWPGLDEALRRRVAALVACFCVGEAAVADQLGPFADAAEPIARTAFLAQATDEQRHAELFERVSEEVLGGGTRRPVAPAFAVLFEDRLLSVVRELARDSARLPHAVGLYHMILEGAVFTAGQLALMQLLRPDGPLPGIRRGVELVLRDERWHIGLGTRCLLDAHVDPRALARLGDEGARAITAWGAAVPAGVTDHVADILRRRLGVIAAARVDRDA